MPDIRIHRPHALGLEQARHIAAQWTEQARDQFDLQCTVTPGDAGDTVQFKRTGLSGQLTVAADHFQLHAQLGMLLGAFAKSIEAEIEKNLDSLLGLRDGVADKAHKAAVGK